MINHKYKFIFVHIPKCAGSTMEFLGKKGLLGGKYNKMISGWDERNKVYLQHCTILQFKKLYNIDVESYFTFTFVRNPWDRAVSDFKAWSRKSTPHRELIKDTNLKRLSIMQEWLR